MNKMLAVAVLTTAPVLVQAAVDNTTTMAIDFEELSLPTESFYNPGSLSLFASNNVTFLHEGSVDGWKGFSYSNRTDTSAEGMDAETVAQPGEGGWGSSNYGVAKGVGATLIFGEEYTVCGAKFANTAYNYDIMSNGSGVEGGPRAFGERDQFNVVVRGFNRNGDITGYQSVRLGRGTDIQDDWRWQGLESLGEVYGLIFDFNSSDTVNGTMLTPAQFAIDQLTLKAPQPVPLPAAFWLLGSALVGLVGLKRAKR